MQLCKILKEIGARRKEERDRAQSHGAVAKGGMEAHESEWADGGENKQTE